MVNSMTGFAARTGALGTSSWAWDIRSVNGRGLDIRLRLPDGMDKLEARLRKDLGAVIVRGNVNLTLRLQKLSGALAVGLDDAHLKRVVAALKVAEAEADAQGVTLTASTAAQVLGLRGVLEMAPLDAENQDDILAALNDDVPTLIAEFTGARADEGAAIKAILSSQLDRVDQLVGAAATAASARSAETAGRLRENLAKVLQNTDGVDEARVAQELALLAVKADVAEEIDRLRTHISAAQALLVATGAIGRKFDFLMQEFNRETNTLCSKSGDGALTAIGLDLKVVVDQMREQVQNVE